LGGIKEMKKLKRLLSLILIMSLILVGASNYIIESTNDRYDIKENLPVQVAADVGNYLPFDEIPKDLINAVVAVEDQRFFSHIGFDIFGLGRALLVNIKKGSIEQGGSTISQQLTKNLFLPQEQTLERKVKEFFLTIELERKYSKEEIIEMYLNYSYFGAGAYGIAEASQRFFNKDVRDLSLEECAMLAGVIKGPSIYNPIEHEDKAIERQRIVLRLMKDEGYISEEQVDF